MKKVLIIAYYWPPSASVAMHRWYFMSKYLADSGLDVHVLAPKNADYPSIDKNKEELIPGVKLIRRNIWEVRKIFNKSTNTSTSKTDDIFFKDKEKLTLKEKLSLWVRGNIFIPDARLPWYYQIRMFVSKYIKQHEIDVLITTGPPHSIHLNGLYAKKKTNVKWIADLRDPWTTIEYHNKMPMTTYARTKHKKLEGRVMKGADQVITVSQSWAKEFRELGGKKVAVVYNGYEESLFEGIKKTNTEKFIIAHLGTLRSDRNPENLWKVLENIKSKVEFEIHLYGEVSSEVRTCIAEHSLLEQTTYHGQVSHRQAIEAMISSDLLLLLVNKDQNNSKGRIPAKIFEYLRSGSKILILAYQEGDAASITHSFPNVQTANYENYKQILDVVEAQTASSEKIFDREQAEQYSRENQALNLSNIINTLV